MLTDDAAIPRPMMNDRTKMIANGAPSYEKKSNAIVANILTGNPTKIGNFFDVRGITIEKIIVNAQTENSKARVTGTGEIEVHEGNNEIKLIVTAENGNERTYIIKALVKEIDPIEVKINDKNYHVVKKESILPEFDDFEKRTIEIGNDKIPVLYNIKTKYTLVGLRDENGNISMYIYDEKNKTYTLYKEIKTNGIRVNYVEVDDVDYVKEEIEINGEKVIAYKKDGLDFYLIYGTNIATGKTNWYTYDIEEKTLQRYIEKNYVTSKKIENKRAIIILSSLIAIMTLFLLIASISLDLGCLETFALFSID